MAVDYDLIVLGGSREGRFAALQAAHLRSRVALIEPPLPQPPDFLSLFYQHLRQGIEPVVARSRALLLADRPALALLATQGVDVRVGQARFEPPIAITVNGKRLRSRTYLLAPPAQSEPLDRALSLEAIAQSDALPTGEIAISGNDPIGLELSQILARSGAAVTLHLPRSLAGTDTETELLLRSCLEADGVQIESEAAIDSPTHSPTKILSTRRQPQLAALNLDAIGIQLRAGVVPVNSRLQTTNPQIYACGEALGGYWLPQLAEREAAIAVENALFWPRQRIDYCQIPWTIQTQPELAQVGLTEQQARRHYGADVRIVRCRYSAIDKANVSGYPIGLSKIILRRNGTILGAHLVGLDASETITPIALALQQQLPLSALSAIAPNHALAKILVRSAQQWQRDRRPHWQLELLERWFDWRR